MKKLTISRCTMLFSLAVLIFSTISCTTEQILEDEQDPIAGKWFLVQVNDTDVANIDCYRDSYIESDAKTITFFIQDRLENGQCSTVLSNTGSLSIEEGFYFLGEEAIEIYITNNELEWRVDIETNLKFQK